MIGSIEIELKVSLESARQAVSEEGEIDIPEDIVTVFRNAT
jgi:hypothetical protein